MPPLGSFTGRKCAAYRPHFPPAVKEPVLHAV
jgi:hypothetical protein